MTERAEQLKIIEKEVLNYVREQTIDLLQNGNFDYDSYIEIVITAFKSSPALEVGLRKQLQGVFYEDDSSSSIADELLEAVKTLDKRLLPLLFDPLISIRYEKFLKFIADFNSNGYRDILEIRKKFIVEEFPKKTFFRAISVKPQEIHQDSFLSNKARLAKQNSEKIQLSQEPEYEGNEQEYALFMAFHPNRLMFLDDFSKEAAVHVKGGATATSYLISVSEHPEISWMAVATHGSKNYRNFEGGSRVVISRFEISEFYAPARNEVPQMGDFVGEYNFEGTKIDANSPEVERLVPLSLPENWDIDSREYVVRNILGFKSLPQAKASDWN